MSTIIERQFSVITCISKFRKEISKEMEFDPKYK